MADNNKTKGVEASQQTNLTKEIISFLKTIAFIALSVYAIRVTIVEAFRIPSGSMEPTLLIGDHLLVTKFNYNLQLPFISKPVLNISTPARSQIVVFVREDDPATVEDDSDKNIIKRVIGLPGDTVEIRGTQVFLNGSKLDESAYKVWWAEGGLGDFGPYQVPAEHVFVMGDNRDHSKDSRFWTNHFLPVKNIRGRALMIYWSFDSFTRIGTLLL